MVRTLIIEKVTVLNLKEWLLIASQVLIIKGEWWMPWEIKAMKGVA